MKYGRRLIGGRIVGMRHHGKKAEFVILVPNGDVLTATGSFREDGHNVGMVSYHPQLTPWIRLPACSMAELQSTMAAAAVTLGGTLTVTYTALTDNLDSLEAIGAATETRILIAVKPLPPLASGIEAVDLAR